jgi:hypothetical protein
MRPFVDRKAMIAAAEMEVRAEARRHPDDTWGMKEGDTHEYATAVADARKSLRGELLAERLKQVQGAVNTRDHYVAHGWPVPLPARNILAWASEPEKITALYEFDEESETENLDNALTALRAAVA